MPVTPSGTMPSPAASAPGAAPAFNPTVGVPPGAATPPPGPQEVEWLGIEANGGINGVMIGAVEGVAQRAGLMAGDVVVSLNGVPVDSPATMEALTQNGNLQQGTMIVRRNGQRMAFELRNTPAPGIVAPSPQGAQMNPAQMNPVVPTIPTPNTTAPNMAAPNMAAPNMAAAAGPQAANMAPGGFPRTPEG
jgi:hypothetical protein